jgi:hypothetical protein
MMKVFKRYIRQSCSERDDAAPMKPATDIYQVAVLGSGIVRC